MQHSLLFQGGFHFEKLILLLELALHPLQTLDRKLSVLEAGTSQAACSVESELADIEDLLSYANDVLNTGQSLRMD